MLPRFRKVELSAAGRYVLEDGEIELNMADGVVVRDRSQEHEMTVTLTTHRVIAKSGNYAGYFPLELVSSVAAKTGFFRSPKVLLDVHDGELELKFTKKGHSEFYDGARNAVQAKSWKVAVTERGPKTFATSRAGIGGLIRTQQRKEDDMEDVMQEAFTDLDGLMMKAKELVDIADTLSRSTSKSENESSQMQTAMLSVGIASPVTKATAGDLFHTELARELFDFLRRHVDSSGGMLSLPDAYCMINRARGTALISPEDLYKAAQQLERLNLPLRLRHFDSGVVVLQSERHDDGKTAHAIVEMVEGTGPKTALDVANTLNISTTLAKQHLLQTEALGLLCRDDAITGLTFYPNIFLN